jgi:hypothetical protein
MPSKDQVEKARARIRAVLKAKKASELDNSRPLDVHTWSEHPEVNSFVDAIYKEHFADGSEEIRKKHIKVVLLDLYRAWCEDPELKIAYSRNRNDYEARSRYNALHISKLTIEVVDRLTKAGLVQTAKGYKDRETGVGRLSRMWPTGTLIEMFKVARFGPFDIGDHQGREPIILRDNDGKNTSYEDSDETRRMRSVLRDYNSLLRSTFIDIPALSEPFIEVSGGRLYVTQRDKFVRRIFNRGSFEKGGRFSGGWWQNCPKAWRNKIFINDAATSEIDYSGLHIVLLYAKEGIDYWTTIRSDPYELEKPDFLESSEGSRSVAKALMLMALNAANEKQAYRAFRSEAVAGTAEKRLTDKQLGSLLEKMREKHSPIAGYLAADAGIDLMNEDARITEKIIQSFTERSVPILTIHDSYIVPCGEENALEVAMEASFKEVTGIGGVRLKEETERPEAILERGFQRKAMDIRNPALNSLMAAEYQARTEPSRSERYQSQWKQFQGWRDSLSDK